jgi:hypothetical protein
MLNMLRQVLLISASIVLFAHAVPAPGQQSNAKPASTPALSDQLPAELHQVAPGKAVITYANGELTIKARGASLVDVLRAVCSRIGAELDASGVRDEAVLGIAGPGTVRDVLASMLDGSPYDFATTSSANDPTTLARVVVFSKGKDSTTREAKRLADQAKSDADSPPSQDSATKSQEAGQQATQAADSRVVPTLSPVEVQSRVSQVRDLLVQMQSELGPTSGAANLDMNALLKEAEGQVKAEANGPAPLSAPASNRPRGRSRHAH